MNKSPDARKIFLLGRTSNEQLSGVDRIIHRREDQPWGKGQTDTSVQSLPYAEDMPLRLNAPQPERGQKT
jgi:hypothetical protein